MKKIYKDSILFKKILYKEHFVHYDSFGNQDEKHRYEYDITLSRVFCANGIYYQVAMPNCIMHDKKVGRLMVRAIEYAASDFPKNFRLVDELKKRGIYHSL